MASYEQCRQELENLRRLLRDELEREVVSEITLPEPSGLKDELYFTRFVAWSYVVLVEAFPVALKQITNVMRVSDRGNHKKYATINELILALRTAQSHNMAAPSQSNERHKKISKAWMIENAGVPPVWDVACVAICTEFHDLLKSIIIVFNSVIEKEEDREPFIDGLRSAYESHWPSHAFDGAVALAAEDLGLENFDVVAYRNRNIKNWRELAALFLDRRAAQEAVEKAIGVELQAIFGRVKC